MDFRRTELVAAIAVVGATLTACGSDDRDPTTSAPHDATVARGAEPARGGGSTRATHAAGGPSPCAVITKAALDRWTGHDDDVGGDRHDAPRVQCNAVVDPDDPLTLDWTLEPPTLPFSDYADDRGGRDVRRSDLTLAGGAHAVRHVGSFGGTDGAHVVMRYRGRILTVTAESLGLVGSVPRSTLGRLATDVAAAYAADASRHRGR